MILHAKHWKMIYAAALAPLCERLVFHQIPYWYSSGVDRGDALFFVAGVLLVAAVIYKYACSASEKIDIRATPFLLLSVAGMFAGRSISMNALIYISSVAIAFSGIWLLWGWRFFWRLVPAAVLILLSVQTTAVSTILSVFDLFFVKIVIGSVAAAYAFVYEFKPFVPALGDVLFYACLALVPLTTLTLNSGVPYGDHIRLSLSGGEPDSQYVTEETALDEATARFFSESRNVISRVYFGNDGRSFSLFEVTTGESVNNIHKSSVCFSTGGWNIVSSTYRTVTMSDSRRLSLEEIEMKSSNGVGFLLYTWYTSEAKGSTGRFVDFRRAFSPSDTWYVYQIMTPIGFSKTETRVELEKFISRYLASPFGKKRK